MTEELTAALLSNLDYATFVLLVAAGVAALRVYLRQRTGVPLSPWQYLLFGAFAAGCWWPVDWAGERAQEGIRNLLGEDGYVPTQAKTDGTTMVYTYKAPRQIILSVETEF